MSVCPQTDNRPHDEFKISPDRPHAFPGFFIAAPYLLPSDQTASFWSKSDIALRAKLRDFYRRDS